MTRRLRRRPPPLIVDLCRRDVLVPQQILHLCDIDASIQEQRCRRRPQTVRCVDALLDSLPVLIRPDPHHRTGQPLQVSDDDLLSLAPSPRRQNVP